MREKHFNFGIIAIVTTVIGYLLFSHSIELSSLVGMFGAVGFNVVLVLSLGFGLQYFQMGTDRDIQEEIYDENNVAAAIYQAGIWLALAIVIAKGVI